MPSPLRPGGNLFPAALLFLSLLCHPLSGEESGSVEGAGEDYLAAEWEDRGITVNAGTETTQQIRVIRREEIGALHSPDLAELLREAADLGVTRYGGYGNQASINLRGFDSRRIAFLIDGVPVNSAMAGTFEISQIDLGGVDRIEVVSGGSDSRYNVSGALGGIVNIITVKKQPLGFHFRAGLANTSSLPGPYRDRSGGGGRARWEDLLDAQRYTAAASWGAEKFSLSANAFVNRADNHFLYRDYLDTVRRKEKNEVWDTGAAAALVRNLGGLASLILGGTVYYGDKNIPTSGGSTQAGKQQDLSTRQNLMIEMPRAFRDDLAAEGSLSHSWQTLDYRSPADKLSRHDEHSLTLVNRWSWYPQPRLTLRAGGDYRYTLLDSTDLGLHHRHQGGAWLTAEYRPRLLEALLVIPSVKLVSGGGPPVAVPKLGLRLDLGEAVSLRNNYFRGFKFPDLEDLYWNDGQSRGNPDLRPEDGWGADLGGTFRLQDRLTVESSVFVQWTVDSIHWYNTAPGGIWRPENVGEAVFFGGEVQLQAAIPLTRGPVTRLLPALTYRYLDSYLLSYGYTLSSDKRIPYMPRHTLGASIQARWKSGSLRLGGHFESLRYADTANLSPLPPRFLLDLTLNQEIGRGLSLHAALRNLLNTSWESFKDYPMPGLTLTAGLNFKL